MKLLSRVYCFLWIFFLSCSSALAAEAVDSFEVILGKETAKVGEALDITISAVDRNGEIVTDYRGDILVFSESDAEAEFPNELAENSYTFTAANEGTMKFENAVRFKNEGLQDLYVYDLNDDSILGVAEVTISAQEVEQNAEITILSPENGVTLPNDTITVSGTTRKNHQVRIKVNDNQDLFTTSNADGVFEKEVEDLLDGTNTISAFILNADNEVIGEAPQIEVKISASVPVFKSITITPVGEVEAESEIQIEVVSNAGLSEVQAIINDVVTILEEANSGIYRATTNAPSEAGDYDVDVVLRDEFALETRERGVETISVVARPELDAGPEETPREEPVVEEIDETPSAVIPESLDLQITDIKVTELKTRSIITWKDLEDAESYNIYKKISDNQVELIENTSEARYEIAITGDEVRYDEFAIKAVGRTSTGVTVQGDLSEMTRVQTGPEMYILFALLALIVSGGIFYMRREAV